LSLKAILKIYYSPFFRDGTLLGSFFLYSEFAFIKTAFSANPVINNRGAAIRTSNNGLPFSLVMCPSFFCPGFGKPVFWMWHINI
jgi:hypothetical protein